MGSLHRGHRKEGGRRGAGERPNPGDEGTGGDGGRRTPQADPRRDEGTPIPALGRTVPRERTPDLPRLPSILVSRICEPRLPPLWTRPAPSAAMAFLRRDPVQLRL